MSITLRAIALTLALTAIVATATIQAQQPQMATVVAPIAGATSNGGNFSGTLLIKGFELRNDRILATGTLSGTLADRTTGVRNVVTQIAVPLDAIGAGPSTAADAVAAQGSCEALHLELESATLVVLGTNVALDGVAFDIATARTSVGAQAASPRGITNTATRTATAASPIRPSGILGATQLSPPTPTSPVETLRPGTAVPAQSTRAGAVTASAQPPLGELLCSVNRLSMSTGSRAQLVQMLNQMLAILG